MCYISTTILDVDFLYPRLFACRGVEIQFLHEIAVTPFLKEQVAAFPSKTQVHTQNGILCILSLFVLSLHLLFTVHKITFHQF